MVRKIIRKTKNILLQSITKKKIDIDSIPKVCKNINRTQIFYFCLSSNVLKIIENEDGSVQFFKKCYKKENKSDFFCNVTNEFIYKICQRHKMINFNQHCNICTNFTDFCIEKFQKYIIQKLTDLNFITKLAKYDLIYEKYNLSIWEDDFFLSEEILFELGLNDCPESIKNMLPLFSWYIRGMSYIYRSGIFVKNNEIINTNVLYSVASYQLANILEFDDVIVKSEFCELNIDGEKEYGVLSDCSIGQRALDQKCNITNITPQLMISLFKLNIFDLVSYQIDHGPNNYNLIANDYNSNEISYSGVCAFDNDNPKTFFPIFSVKCKIGVYDKFIQDGKINQPISVEILRLILSADLGRISTVMKSYLNKIQICSLLYRIKSLKKICNDFMNNDSTLKIESLKFSEITRENISNWGKYYLDVLLNK